jgi:hypothetical protein
MSRPDRFERAVCKVLKSLGKPEHGPWPEPIVQLLRREHGRAMKELRKQLRYEKKAIEHNGRNVRWHYYAKQVMEHVLAALDKGEWSTHEPDRG